MHEHRRSTEEECENDLEASDHLSSHRFCVPSSVFSRNDTYDWWTEARINGNQQERHEQVLDRPRLNFDQM